MAAVPEPRTWALLMSGIGWLALARRRRATQATIG
ncbi:MAG: PEP-CTERM sorting domain-containing protein [Burkholderiaceae bacterium]|nr:PEP-CTERM sorting domain-containing protein [Burkholderiaceae bacterium]